MAENGRVVIPAAVRRESGVRPGEQLTVRAEDGAVILETRGALLRRIQSEYREHGGKPDAVERLIESRRAEARREREGTQRSRRSR